ncbi:glycosyl hydrolase family 18 protein [Nitrospirillum iridis]|uniref:Chitinase n=1 Tax=Nitrospirillum iridis TaxID=765888 RepID=A0A7X0AYL3_9PROT|nr:glycosyl hydrolase family 18 protein [Nitrospirillum iridis]MBB6251076.1 chitinase [Nitrospirillum iridis]
MTNTNLPVRNVIYVQGPYYTSSTAAYQLNGNTVTAQKYYAVPLAVPDTTFILCFAHFKSANNGYELVINNVPASTITDNDMGPVSAAAKSGTQFLISIGGADNPNDWTSIDADPTACATALATFMNDYGITGIDIDMENSATATQVYAFIKSLASLVDGLIVTGSPYDVTTDFYAALAALDCANTTQYIKWYNYQWYGDGASLKLDTFKSISSTVGGWYSSNSTAYNSAMLNVGVAPTVAGSSEGYAAIAAFTVKMTASTVPWGGFSWWNYPTLTKFSS